MLEWDAYYASKKICMERKVEVVMEDKVVADTKDHKNSFQELWVF